MIKTVGVLKKNDTINYIKLFKDDYGLEMIKLKFNNTLCKAPLYYFDLLNRRSNMVFDTEKSLAIGVLKEDAEVFVQPRKYNNKSLGKLYKGNEVHAYEIKQGDFGMDYVVLKHKKEDVFVLLSKFKNSSDIKLKFTNKKCHYFKNEIDEFNGTKKVMTEVYGLNNYNTKQYGDIGVELQKIGRKKLIWFHSNRDLGCASSYRNNRSFVKVKLENNQIVSFYHFGDVDCSDFSIVARLTQSDILKLKKSPIKAIRLSGTKYYHDIKEVEWKTFFIDKLDCIK